MTMGRAQQQGQRQRKRVRGVAAVYAAVALLLGASPVVDAHGVLISPQARDGMAEGVGTKLSPLTNRDGTIDFEDASTRNSCPLSNEEESMPGDVVAVVNPGQRIYVKYNIGIAHQAAPGVGLAIQIPGQTFDDLRTGFRIVEDNEGNDATSDGDHFTALIIPDNLEDTDKAVLQWGWISTSDGGGYIGCADIEISATKATCGVFGDLPDGTIYHDYGSCSGAAFDQGVVIVAVVAAIIVAGFVIWRAPQCADTKDKILDCVDGARAKVAGHGLPEGWTAQKDPASGDTYYVNEITGESSWDKPKPAPEIKQVEAPPASHGQERPAMPHPLVAGARRGAGRGAGRGPGGRGGRGRAARGYPARPRGV